jgi:ABC-2 type transport system ATP-binding protein
MEEADRLCHRIGIVDHGKIIAMDTSDKLKNEIGGDIITIISPQGDALYSIIQAMPDIKNIKRHDSSITIRLKNSEKHVAQIVMVASENGIPVDSLSIHKPTLEDVFLHFTGRKIREEEASIKDQMRMNHRARRR